MNENVCWEGNVERKLAWLKQMARNEDTDVEIFNQYDVVA